VISRATPSHWDLIIVGAGASGMMCAATAGYRGLRVLIIDHAPKAGAKIRISGGGKCNFTNRWVAPANFHSQNPHFVKSALARYHSSLFIDLVERHGIDYEERDHGQLFTRHGAGEIIAMLRTECDWAGVEIRLNCSVNGVEYSSHPSHIPEAEETRAHYWVQTSQGSFTTPKLVVATGALSYPKLKASDFGYRIAKQFDIPVVPLRPGLVGLSIDLPDWAALAGISLPATLSCQGHAWTRDLLFTHTGISGPVVLLISNLWREGLAIGVNLLPQLDAACEVLALKAQNKELRPWLRSHLPKRLADYYWMLHPLEGKPAELPDETLRTWAEALQNWQITPTATDGYGKAEVTVGGVDTQAISSKTMEALTQSGLYFIGEVLDVTGDLGGYNFQWAWASGVACGMAV
jgi:predicted Rossmann fold flavoprotein